MNNIDKFIYDFNEILEAAFEYYLEYQYHDGVLRVQRFDSYKKSLESFVELLTKDSE